MKQIFTLLFSLSIFYQAAKAQDYLYQQSFELINDMLEGKEPYSFKKAVFSVENAYHQGRLDTVNFEYRIDFRVNLAKSLMKSRILNYQGKDIETISKYAALFTVMNDTIPVLDKNENKHLHIPFSYDFDDPFGYDTWQSMFVSKLLDTKKGNCHSLPYLYKILAEELGVEAHLALAPNHVYIKHRSERYGWYNTELTSGIFPIDAWLMASGYVHIDAIRNGVYMKALNKYESLALCLIDLAQGYQRQDIYDLGFVIECADKALEYYPNFVNAMILKTEAKGKIIENILYLKNTDFTDATNYPETQNILLEIQSQLRVIHELGYRQMPEDMYLNWLVSLKQEREKYANKKISIFNNN